MITSFNLLKELVALPDEVTAQDLANKLTFSGFEVEEIKPLAQADHLTVGQIVSLENHPNSDHLHLLKVDCGAHGVLDIVCGAPNVKLGAKVIVSLVGANLPAKQVVIKKSTIAGYESNGMCCSLLELGVDESTLSEEQKNGIEILPDSFKVGDDNVLGLLGLDDVILDINVLANRPDLLSVQGMAKEVAALYNAEFKSLPRLEKVKVSHKIKVDSLTPACDVFHMLAVKTSGIAQTPEKMKHYLRALGYRPIKLAVDIGNFVMALTGQPFHFYDLKKVESLGPVAFVVRDDFEGSVLTLDEHDLPIIKEDLVVTNGQTPMCLAGVMGLKNVATDDDSCYFGIEAANFHFARVRHTVNRTGLFSASSALFIKKVNPYMTKEALMIAAGIYKLIDPSFEVISYDYYDNLKKPNTKIKFSLKALNHRLGGDFTREEVDDVFFRLRLKKIDDSHYEVPIDRPDLKEQADLDEEVFRFNDPNRLNHTYEGLPITAGELSSKQKFEKKIRENLISSGLLQIFSYTLVDEKIDRSYRLFNEDVTSIKVANPMTEDHLYVRSDLVGSMVKTIEYNKAHQRDDFALFELCDLDFDGKVNTYLSLGLSGKRLSQGLMGAKEYDFYDLKNLVVKVLTLNGLDSSRYTLVPSSSNWLHPYRSADVMVGKQKIASFGQVHPEKSKKVMLVGEVDISALLAIHGKTTKFSAMSIYPDVERDLALVLDDSITAQQLLTVLKKNGTGLLKSIEIFDVFPLENNTHSMAVKLHFGAMDHTLKDEEIKLALEKMVSAVTATLGGHLR